jgi:hypothetical protein
VKLKKIEKHIVKFTISKNDYSARNYEENLNFLESKKIVSFGDMNTKILEKFFKEKGYNPKPIDLCLDDDKSIGLEVPKTWYLNRGRFALSIAAYYNFLNFQEISENNKLLNSNKEITDKYGMISCIEIYLEKELRQLISSKKIKYFSTPRTLTECIRYLEGWNIQEYPRLKDYAAFSKFIELWSSTNFPNFNRKEWYLGKYKSSITNRKNKSNIREAVKYFWMNYLLKRREQLLDKDIEIDILEGEKFANIRQPNVILISEELFGKDKKMLKNSHTMKNARAAKKIYPKAIIVVIENDKSIKRPSSLLSSVKYGVNNDVIIAVKIIKTMFDKNLI